MPSVGIVSPGITVMSAFVRASVTSAVMSAMTSGVVTSAIIRMATAMTTGRMMSTASIASG